MHDPKQIDYNFPAKIDNLPNSPTAAKQKNLFVQSKKPKSTQKRNPDFGFEFDADVKSDTDFYKKIFDNDSYGISSEQVIDYYEDISRLLEAARKKDSRNVGAFMGLAILGAIGFLAFSFTIVGGIVGGVLGVTLGRYAGKKLKKKQAAKVLTQEVLFVTKLECLIKLGKLQSQLLKHNLNKFRLTLEKILEEASICFEVSIFKDTKRLTTVLLKFKEFMLKVDVQKAILLSYKLFKVYLIQTDFASDHGREDIAAKVRNVFEPYIFLMEFTKPGKQIEKKVKNLATYQKIKRILNQYIFLKNEQQLSEDIAKVLQLIPNQKKDPMFLNDLKEFLQEQVNLDEKIQEAAVSTL